MKSKFLKTSAILLGLTTSANASCANCAENNAIITKRADTGAQGNASIPMPHSTAGASASAGPQDPYTKAMIGVNKRSIKPAYLPALLCLVLLTKFA